MSRLANTPTGGKERKKIPTNVYIDQGLAQKATITNSDIVNGQHAIGTVGTDYFIYRYSSTQPTIVQDAPTEYSCYDTFIPDFNLQQSTPVLVGGDRLTIRYRVPEDWEACRLFLYAADTSLDRNREFLFNHKTIELTGDALCGCSLIAYKNPKTGTSVENSVGLTASYGNAVLFDDYTTTSSTATTVSWYQYMGLSYNEMQTKFNLTHSCITPSSFIYGSRGIPIPTQRYFTYFIPSVNLYGYIESLSFGKDPNDSTQDVVNLTIVLPVHNPMVISGTTYQPEYTFYDNTSTTSRASGIASPNIVVLCRVPT